jgi:uncharacterized Zn finger protein
MGTIAAKVSGSELYTVKIDIKTLPPKKWSSLKGRCSGQIGSLLELLQGKLSDHVMTVVTDRQEGLFPLPQEISLKCSCPDWAVMCKHVAAVLYGAGVRLDAKPELLFTLRGVNHEDLIQADAEKAVAKAAARGKSKRLAVSEIGDVFGIELDSGDPAAPIDGAGVQESGNRAKRSPRAKAGKAPRKQRSQTDGKAVPTPPKKVVKKPKAKKARVQAA